MQFKAVIQTDILRSILNSITCLNTETVFDVSPDGMKTKAADPASCAMVELEIKAGAFEYFKADSGKMGLDLLQLSDVLVGKENTSLEIDEEKKLQIVMGKIKYGLRLVDPTAIKGAPRVPEIDLNARVAIEAEELRAALKAALKIVNKNESLCVSQDDEKFSLTTKTEASSFVMDFPLSECLVQHGESHSNFSIDYLNDVAKAIQGRVQIESGLDYPLIFRCGIGEHVKLTYIFAPRIDQD